MILDILSHWFTYLLVTVIFSAGVWAGIGLGLTFKQPIKCEIGKYKLQHEKVSIPVIRYHKELYYSATGINALLKDKYNLSLPHLRTE